MNLKSKIITFAAASIFALSLGTSVYAEKVSQEITAGSVLTASLAPDSSLATKPYSHQMQTSDGTLVLRVEDGRGTNAGWSVTLQAGPFNAMPGTNAQAIPASGFRLTGGGQLTATAGSPDGIQIGQVNTPLNSAQRVLRADQGKGTGIYSQELQVQLDIPGGQTVGTYQSDVIVNIASGPGQ